MTIVTVSMTQITEDEYGFPTTFECQNVALNQTDIVTNVTIDFFYDLAFSRPSDEDELEQVTDLARAFVEGSLLQQLAAYYGFWDGQACQGQLEGLVWFIKLSSLHKDVPNPLLSSCYELQPLENEECVSYQAIMTGEIVGLDDTLDTVSLMAQQMNADAVTATTNSLRVKFLGTELDYGNDAGRDNLPPALNVVQETYTAPEDNRFTIVGIAIVVGMSLTVLALAIVIMRRRRRVKSSFQHQEFQDVESKSEGDTGSETFRLEGGSNAQAPGRDVDGEILMEEDNLPETPDEFSREYDFDLGGWMKSELVGIHGTSAITAQPSFGGPAPPPSDAEMLSDSDNDSWAQTEATIGSLELRLDPIEAEV